MLSRIPWTTTESTVSIKLSEWLTSKSTTAMSNFNIKSNKKSGPATDNAGCHTVHCL